MRRVRGNGAAEPGATCARPTGCREIDRSICRRAIGQRPIVAIRWIAQQWIGLDAAALPSGRVVGSGRFGKGGGPKLGQRPEIAALAIAPPADHERLVGQLRRPVVDFPSGIPAPSSTCSPRATRPPDRATKMLL